MDLPPSPPQGINTLPQVQECFKVLRDVVIHSLGIGSSSAAPVANTGRGGAIGSGLMPSTKNKKAAKHKGSVSPSDRTVAVAKTPSPNSRQSSGFGSLQDEEGAGLCESFSRDLTKPAVPAHATPTVRTVPSERASAQTWAVPSRPAPSLHPHPHLSLLEQHELNTSTVVVSPRTRKGSLNDKELQVPTYVQPHPSGGHNEALVPRPSLFDMEEAEGPQSFTKSKSRRSSQKQSREHQELRQHQELVGEVQLLALRVEEEELQYVGMCAWGGGERTVGVVCGLG